jgi:integrase/recombinase XerD
MNNNYQRLSRAYGEWLKALNYESTNAKVDTARIRSFLTWADLHELKDIEQITATDIRTYYEELTRQISPRTGKGLSIHTLKSHVKGLKRFSRYLLETNQAHLEIDIRIKNPKIPAEHKEVFTSDEIKKLYAACDDTALGMRDRAMLSVYYGCGLRRTEGVMLELPDVQFRRGILHVRKGKNYKERYVPMTGSVISDLMEYMMISRPKLAGRSTNKHFFIGRCGEPLEAVSMHKRLERLKRLAEIEKTGSLHALRHSIATHLLQRGMNLEQIARLLGHSCLESTQIYTHIAQSV